MDCSAGRPDDDVFSEANRRSKLIRMAVDHYGKEEREKRCLRSVRRKIGWLRANLPPDIIEGINALIKKHGDDDSNQFKEFVINGKDPVCNCGHGCGMTPLWCQLNKYLNEKCRSRAVQAISCLLDAIDDDENWRFSIYGVRKKGEIRL